MNRLGQLILQKANQTYTENGDVTMNTSSNSCVDMFFKIGAARSWKKDKIIAMFQAAWNENQDAAIRILLWARDAREGAGERRVSREIFEYIDEHSTDVARAIIRKIPELGRMDDLFIFKYNREAAFYTFALELTNNNSLAAKWAPRERSKNKVIARELAAYLGLTMKEYRKFISQMSNTVEQQLCAKKFDEIEYDKVPSKASLKYSKAFHRHDPKGYTKFIENVNNGTAKINAGAVFPYDVLKSSLSGDKAAEVMWKNLPDFVPENLSFIPMIDTSGSMGHRVSDGLTAMTVASSLGIYLSERNKSEFKNLFLTFSSEPRFGRIPNTNLSHKHREICSANWQMSTDVDKAFNLVLETAFNNNVPQEDMPDFLIILSDMQFNAYGGDTPVAERTRDKFKSCGYKLPNIIWWNIASRGDVTPVSFNDKGMALVSGFSPSIVKNLLQGEVTPISIMNKTIMVERYQYTFT